jgi:hypothetical protein
MAHKYKNIFGHFNFESVYDNEVNKSENGYKFLEVGTFLGKSAIYMAEKIKESGKNIELHVLDTFKSMPSGEYKEGKDFFDEFKSNIKSCGVDDIIVIHRGDSLNYHINFEKNYFDFIYIDGNHTYEYVKSDIENFLPKLKNNRNLAGHDYFDPDVLRATSEILGTQNLKFYQNTWIYNLNK